MSIFDKDLDKGGTLRDVVNIKNFSYANGRNVLEEPISASLTVVRPPSSSFTAYAAYINPESYMILSEFDTESNWPLFSDGFICNAGKVKYSQIFSEEFQKSINMRHSEEGLYLDDIRRAILDGHIETLFVPYPEDIYWSLRYRDLRSKYPNFEDRWMKQYDWWKLVANAIKEGIENIIDPKVGANVLVTSSTYSGWSSAVDESLNNTFFVTIKIYRHKDLGDIFWPCMDDEAGQLFEVTGDYDAIKSYHPIVGRPVSISMRLDIEYKGYENIH